MRTKVLPYAALCVACAFYFTSCGDDETVFNDNLNIVSELDPEDCNDKTEGSMTFVKPKATMYVCSEGEWIAMNDQEAIKYRCESKELKDKSGFDIICDGETIGTIKNGLNGADGKDGKDGKAGADGKDGIDGKNGKDGSNGKNGTNGTNGVNGKNGENGKDGVSADTAAINKAVNETLTNAAAKSQNDVDVAIQSLSSASATAQKDIDNALKSLSSATNQFDEEINNKFSSAFSEWNEELEDKACRVADTARDEEHSVIIVTIQCGDAQTELKIPYSETVVNENLSKVYNKHVVVRFPVQTSKKTNSEIYEDVWTNFKGGDNAELTVMDLDEKLAPNGKMFVTDLFAAAANTFTTIEETNEKTEEYKIVRLEGDLDITNLSTPIVQLRVKLDISGDFYVAFSGTNSLNIIYNALVDLSEESDTVVVDFLTDYKAARIKNLVNAGSKFAVASTQANEELAEALSLIKKGSDKYPSFEHYVPNQIGFTENFNSIAWVISLIDQSDMIPSFNQIYSAYRNVFAEHGDFNTAISITYNGKEANMFFADYLTLLIDAHFYKSRCLLKEEKNCAEEALNDAMLYKIVQKGLISAYGLDTAEATNVNENIKELTLNTDGVFFKKFIYNRNTKLWIPIIEQDSEVTIESSSSLSSGKSVSDIANEQLGACDEKIIGSMVLFNAEEAKHSTKTGYDYLKCDYISEVYRWVEADELDKNETLKACTNNRLGEIAKYEQNYYTCSNKVFPSSSSSNAWELSNENAYANYKLGTCDEDLMYYQEAPVKLNNKYYKCDCIDGSNYKWVDAETDEKLGSLCLYDKSSAGQWIYPDTVEGNKFDYYHCTVNDNNESEWIKLDATGYCNIKGKNLIKYDGTAELKKFICKYNDEYYYKDTSSNSNASWISVNEYCGKPNGTSTAPTNGHAVNNSCVFPISDEAVPYVNDTTSFSDDAETTLYYSYDNSVYFTYTEVEKGEYGWDFTALVKFYCTARTGRNVKGAKCWFENEIHTYNYGWN